MITEQVNPSFAKPPLAAWFATQQDELVTPDELATLKELEAEWRILEEQQNASNNDAPRRELQAVRNEYQANPTPQGFKKLQKLLDSKEATRARHREVRRQVEAAIAEFAVKRVAPVVEPVLRKAAKKVGEFAVSVRRHEEDVANQVGVAHCPSNAVLALDALVRNLNLKADGLAAGQYRGEASPRSFLRGILEL